MISLHSFMLRLFVLLAILINVCVGASRHGELRENHHWHPTRDHEIFPHGHGHTVDPSDNDGRGRPNENMETDSSNDPRNNEGPPVSERQEMEPETSEPRNNNHNNTDFHRTKPLKRSSHSVNHQRSRTHKEPLRKPHMAVTKGRGHTHNWNPRKHQSIHRRPIRHGSKSLQPLKKGRKDSLQSNQPAKHHHSRKNHQSHGSKNRGPLKHRHHSAAPQRSGANNHKHHNHKSHTPPRKLYEGSPSKDNRRHSGHGGHKRQAVNKDPNSSENRSEDPNNGEGPSSEKPTEDDKENRKTQLQKRKGSKVKGALGGERGSELRGHFKHRSHSTASQRSGTNRKDHSHKSHVRPLREHEEPPSKDDNEEYSNNSGTNVDTANVEHSNMNQEPKNDEDSSSVEPTVDDNKNERTEPNFKGELEGDEINPASEGQDDVMVSPSDDQDASITQVDKDSLPRHHNEPTQQEESEDVIGYDYNAEGVAEDLTNLRITNEVYDQVKDTELGKVYEELYGSLMNTEGNLIEPVNLTPSYGEDYAVNEEYGSAEEKPIKYIVHKGPIIIKIMKLVLGKK